MVSNSLFPKVRHRYGKRLTEKDYESLINFKSVSEIAEYLKANTVYRQLLSKAGVNTEHIDRKSFENMLRKFYFDYSISLCRYGMLSDESFFNIFIIEADIDQILRCIRLIMSGNSERFIENLPEFLSGYTKIKDLLRFSTSRSFEQMLSALEGSPYHKILLPFEGKLAQDHSDGIFYVECALNDFLAENIRLALSKFSGKSKKEMIRTLAYNLDMQFICYVYRAKLGNNISNEEYFENADESVTNFTSGQIKRIIGAQSCEEILEILKSTAYKREFSDIATDNFLEKVTEEILYRKYKHLLRFSKNANSVVYSFIYLSGIEIDNIIKIIEGIRYKIAPEEIAELLVGVHI